MKQAGNRFTTLLEQHKGILYKVAAAYCREAEDRHDLMQEIVLQLWRSFPRYDEQWRFSTWMYRIAMNVAISHYRRTRDTVPLEGAVLELAAEPEIDDDVRVLYDLIGGLDELSRGLVILFLDGHSHDEIAAILGLTSTNVATRLNRIKQRLRNDYQEKAR